MPELPETAFKATDDGVLLCCRVQPGASRSAIVGGYGDEIKIALQAPPVDGKANAALCRLLADWCKIPKGRVGLKSGLTSRSKVLAIHGVTKEELQAILMRQM